MNMKILAAFPLLDSAALVDLVGIEPMAVTRPELWIAASGRSMPHWPEFVNRD